MKRQRGPSPPNEADPMIELGEEMSIPNDWATRGGYLASQFECFFKDHLRFFRHPNGLFVVFLAPDHPVMSHPLRQSMCVTFTPEAVRSLSVTGKKRKDAPRMQPATEIASISVSDGTKWTIKSNLKAALVEVNEGLLGDAPRLVHTTLLDVEDERAYLCILQPKKDWEALAVFKPESAPAGMTRREKRKNRKQQRAVGKSGGGSGSSSVVVAVEEERKEKEEKVE